MADIEIKGMDELFKNLKEYPKKFQKSVATGAVRACAAAITKEAKRNAPKESGLLKKSIKTVKRKKNKELSNIVSFSVVPRLDLTHGYLAQFHEFGTKNMPAHPFMRPAFEKKGKEAINIAAEYMKKRIDKIK